MALVKFKPTSAGRRAMVKVVSEKLYKGRPVQSLLEKKSKSGGRNNKGRITVRHHGGGHKQHYRIVDFRRNKDGIAARPSKGRECFTDWNYFTKDSKLVPSGLLGPVRFYGLH